MQESIIEGSNHTNKKSIRDINGKINNIITKTIKAVMFIQTNMQTKTNNIAINKHLNSNKIMILNYKRIEIGKI